MAFGIYKRNQGYWIRVLTAAGVGILVLAGAAWLWQQMLLVSLPSESYTVRVIGVQGQIADGTPVMLMDESLDSEIAGELEQVGTATLRSSGTDSGGSQIVTLENDIEFADSSVGALALMDQIRSADGSFTADLADRSPVTRNPVFDRIYLQAGVAGAMLIIGAILVYWLVGVKRSTADFLIATDGEMRKVNWSTRKEIQGSTVVVIVASFLIAAILFVVDFGFQTFFEAIGVLDI